MPNSPAKAALYLRLLIFAEMTSWFIMSCVKLFQKRRLLGSRVDVRFVDEKSKCRQFTHCVILASLVRSNERKRQHFGSVVELRRMSYAFSCKRLCPVLRTFMSQESNKNRSILGSQNKQSRMCTNSIPFHN